MIEGKFAGLLLGLCVAMTFSSCMKDEPLNAECDIEHATLHTTAPDQVFFNLADSSKSVLYSDSVISFSVRRSAPLQSVTPEFKVTDGATVKLISGPDKDFTTEHTAHYRVTSQDGNWHRDYTLNVNPVSVIVSDTIKYDFEKFELDSKGSYYCWHNEKPDGTYGDDWATGNPGFKLSMSSAQPQEYPSAPTEGMDGYCLKLVTRSTGPFGAMANKRLAAGNFFMGSFDVLNALREPLASTHFGIPFNQTPVKFEGYYKYTPGEKFQDKAGKEVVGRVDSAAVYALLYVNRDADGNSIVLDGSNIEDSQYIVARAKLNPVTPTKEWTKFDVAFEFYEKLDPEVLENMGYSIAIVFSSSQRGAYFEGAIGSELLIDKVRLICSKEE